MSDSAERRLADKPPIARLFERSVMPLHKLSAFQAMFDEFAQQCAAAMREITSLDTGMTISGIERCSADQTTDALLSTVVVAFRVPAWNASTAIGMDPAMVHAAVVAMCGGDLHQSVLLTRQMTSLEMDIAAHLGTAVMWRLREVFLDVAPFDFQLASVVPPGDTAKFERPISDCLVMSLEQVATAHIMVIAMPVQALELAREKLSATRRDDEPDLDPGWTRKLQHGVSATQVQLVGRAPGPPMTLGDVARLQVGSTIELDQESLQHVRLECGDEPVFEGRLGQSKGHFTICLESPLKGRS